jgi:hypothetical protein
MGGPNLGPHRFAKQALLRVPFDARGLRLGDRFGQPNEYPYPAAEPASARNVPLQYFNRVDVHKVLDYASRGPVGHTEGLGNLSRARDDDAFAVLSPTP